MRRFVSYYTESQPLVLRSHYEPKDNLMRTRNPRSRKVEFRINRKNATPHGLTVFLDHDNRGSLTITKQAFARITL